MEISATPPPPPANLVRFFNTELGPLEEIMAISAITPPTPNWVRLQRSRNISAATPPPPPPNLVGFWRSRKMYRVASAGWAHPNKNPGYAVG